MMLLWTEGQRDGETERQRDGAEVFGTRIDEAVWKHKKHKGRTQKAQKKRLVFKPSSPFVLFVFCLCAFCVEMGLPSAQSIHMPNTSGDGESN
jgi:hypothetical protein